MSGTNQEIEGNNGVDTAGLTTNTIPKATASDTIGNSQITDDGTTVDIGGAPVASLRLKILASDNTDFNGYRIYSNNAAQYSNVGWGGINSSYYLKLQSGSNQDIEFTPSSGYTKFIGNININGLTPSQIVVTDASKNLQSLDTATYPSLTELSYSKGVTSAIQTQLDGKLNNLIAKQNTTISHTGTTAETKLYSALIPAGSVQANDNLKILMKAFGVSGVASKHFRMYFNTSNAIGGVQVGLHTISATVSQITTRNIFCKNSLSSQQVIAPTTTVANEESTNHNAGSYSTVSIDFSLPQYFIVSCQLTTGTESASILGLTLQAER